MDTTGDLVKVLAAGGASSVLFQMGKGEWSGWLTLGLALLAGFGAGFTQGGADAGLVGASAAIASHSAFLRDTRLGAQLKLSIAPRVLRTISELTANLAEAIQPKGNGTPPKP